MRNVACWLTGSLALLVMGCTGGNSSLVAPATNPTPEAPEAIPTASSTELGDVLLVNDLSQSAIGLFTVTIDPNTLSGTVQLKETQRAGAQSEIYNLEIGSFLTADSFNIDAINLTGSTFDVTYTVTHPIPPAADPCGVASAGNRYDLGVVGRVLWLFDGPDGNTYFAGDGDYEANTALALNPDGYYQPGAMVDTTGLTANTFPFQEIVDEAADNRVGISNSGNVHGNYPGSTSWTQAHYTAGITGYGIWGHGQAATNMLSLSLSEIAGGTPFTTDVAILVKYEDPRGAGSSFVKRGNRLPCGDNPVTGDPRVLAYHAPHFALDVSVISNVNEGGGFLDNTASSATVNAEVVDWDAIASEHTGTNLGDATDTSLVSAGESGQPVVDVDIPGIDGSAGDPLTGGAGSGEAGDPIAYTGVVDGTPGDVGVYRGMVRATDPVDITPPTDWDLNHFNLGAGGTLTPVTPNIEGSVLQAFDVNVTSSCVPATVRLTSDFETTVGDNAWIAGFGGLSNFDGCGTFVWARCSAPALPAGMGSSGFRWNTGPDSGSTFCTGDFEEDYGSQSDGNVVSPSINLTGTSCATIQFDGFRNDGGATASHNIFYSTDGGSIWTSLFSQSNAVGTSDPDVMVTADAIAGNGAVLLRFQFEDEASYGAFGCWTPGLFPIAGWAIDNVIVRAD